MAARDESLKRGSGVFGQGAVEHAQNFVLKSLPGAAGCQLFSGGAKRWQSMFESFPLGIFVTDQQGHLIYVNPAAKKMAGLPEGLDAEFNFDEMVFSQDLSQLTLHYLRCVAQELDFSTQLPLVGAGGNVVWLSVHASPLKEDGCFIGHIGSVENITDRKLAEAALVESKQKARLDEQRLQMALQASGIGIWALNVQSGQVIWDERMYELYGVKKESYVPSHEKFLELLHPDDRARVALGVETALSQLTEFEGEYRIVYADGSIHHFVTRGKVIRDAAFEPQIMTGACIDITEHKRLEEAAGQVLIMQEREDFMATLTHDLKTPLLSANRLLEMLASGQSGLLLEEQADALLRLRDSNDSLLVMIQDLLEVYRYEKGAYALTFQKTDIRALLGSVIQELTPLAKSRSIGFVTEIAGDVGEIWLDVSAIKRVLLNLLDNALKFSPASAVVQVKAGSCGDQIVIQVEDSGPGIADAEKMRLFQRFSQGPESNRYRPGVGLGLYLCKQIVEAHGGSITCSSKPGAGAVFAVRFLRDCGRRGAGAQD